MTDALRGLAAMALACTIWGLSPLYYKLLAGVPPLEVLAHRTLWSLATAAGLLWLTGALPALAAALDTAAKRRRTLAAAVMISLNWFGFIYAVQSGQGLQASLGYYIFPLVAVALGRIVFGDRLRPAQWMAVGLAAIAVAVLTAGLGVAPSIALLLAVTFGFYGVLKRGLATGPLASVGAEVLMMAPLATVWLLGVHLTGWTDMTGRPGAVFFQDPELAALLVVSGPLTGAPLLLFAYAARRLILPTLGLIQYLNPTLQLAVAALVFAEPVTRWHALALPVIWAALALYSGDAFRTWRRCRTTPVA